MNRKSKAIPILFAGVMFAFLLAGSTFTVFAADTVPLNLSVSMDNQTNTAIVSVVTTEDIALSNYDFKLSWDVSVFTLTDIENGQSEGFPYFQANSNAESADVGKACAAANGYNVSVDSATVLASYTFTVSEDILDGDYHFRLDILDVADENGDHLSWKAQSTDKTLRIGDTTDVEIKTIYKSDTTVTVVVSCAKTESMVWCAAYKENGQMVAVKLMEVIGDGSEQTYEFDFGAVEYKYVKISILDHQYRPLCMCKQI